MKWKVTTYKGERISQCLPVLAALRIKVFREYPYLYEGDQDFEMDYLDVYVNSPKSIVVIIANENQIIGASTGLPLADESEEFKAPFKQSDNHWDLESIFYFGESVVLKEFRGNGFGKFFFQIRERHAQEVLPNLCMTTFCSVDRPDFHPMQPKNYKPLDNFWKRMGYSKNEKLKAQFDWKQVDEDKETSQSLTFWTKPW